MSERYVVRDVVSRVSRQHVGILVAVVILGLLSQMCWVLSPFSFAQLINRGKIMTVLGVVPVVLFLLGYTMDYLGDMLEYSYNKHLTNALAHWSAERLFFAFSRRGVNSKMTESINTLNRLPQTCTQIFHDARVFVLGLLLATVVCFGMCMYIHPGLAIFMTTSVLLLGALFGYMLYRSVHYTADVERQRDLLLEDVGDTLVNMPSVYAGNQMTSELQRIHDGYKNIQDTDRRAQKQIQRLRLGINALYLIIALGMLLLGAYLYHTKRISAALVATVVMLSMYMIYNFDELSINSNNLIRNIGKLKQSQDFLNDLAAHFQGHPDGTDATPPRDGGLEFRDVTVFVKENVAALQNVNLTIQPGEIVLLAGLNGSGKTTLLKTLFGALPFSGTVLFGGQDLNQMTASVLRSHITYVPQVPFLFNRTVYENISYGNGASRETVQTLMDTFGVTFVTLDDVIGSNHLSGGQQQLIYLLRAYLLNHSKVLLLDEPTSALDDQTRDRVMVLLSAIMKGRTVLLVTHDAELQKYTTRTIVLTKGQITSDSAS